MTNATQLSVQHSCSDCGFRKSDFFCELPEPVLKVFESIKIPMNYPKGTSLFLEGDSASGVYTLCRGKIKMSTHSADGRALILRISGPGEWLGLSAVIAGRTHEATAEVIENCQINFVRKQDFLRFIREYPDAGLSALRQLSVDYQHAYTQICSLGLSSSVSDKLAKLLMTWCADRSAATGTELNGSPIKLKLTFSHEEIAEMIGTSRETVTRMLKDFRERGLITLKGADLVIPNYRTLERSIGTRGRSSRSIM